MSVKRGRTGRLSMGARAVLIFTGLCTLAAMAFALSEPQSGKPPSTVKDPGVRGGGPGAGGPISGLSSTQTTTFNDGQTNFSAVFGVPTTTTNGGLGPVFNSNSCSSCHMQPAVGGDTPNDLAGGTGTNQLFSVYQANGATNSMPSFETTNGPELIARFPYMSDLSTPDGSMHQLFTVTGRSDAKGCTLAQPDFSQAQSQNNLSLRRPIETFGDGLIEIIQNNSITSQATLECASQSTTGVCGVPSIDIHDGDVNRLGWKAQWRGLIVAAAEELNSELGVTNEYFPNEVNQTQQSCLFNGVPESGTNFVSTIQFDQFTGDPERMALFMSFLAPPIPATFNQYAQQGQTDFNTIGCNNCHKVSYTTPLLASMGSFMQNKTLNLYSDLLLHHMGNCLADNIVQGTAQGDMWRTPPLWGAGKRAFFMHDGRTSDLLVAIQDHVWNAVNGTGCTGSYPTSEALNSINAFNALSARDQQDVLDFLRDL